MKTITLARWVSLVAAFVWGAVAEWHLAVAVGADRYTAALLPLVLDVYGWAAMRSGRTKHIAAALFAMVSTQAVSHLLTLGSAPRHIIALSIAVSAFVPAVSYFCHLLGEPVETPAETPAEDVKSPATMTTATSPEFPRAGSVPVAVRDEIHHWTRVDTPAETVDVVLDNRDATFAPDDKPVEASVAVTESTTETADADDNSGGNPDDVQDDAADDTVSTDRRPTKAEIAAKAVALKAELGTWKAVAEEMGLSRQWIGRCVSEAGVTV